MKTKEQNLYTFNVLVDCPKCAIICNSQVIINYDIYKADLIMACDCGFAKRYTAFFDPEMRPQEIVNMVKTVFKLS